MYQGITLSYFLLALFKVSQTISNKYLASGSTSILNVPFGLLYPSLVPCPPDIVATANCPFAKIFFPKSFISSNSSKESLFFLSAEIGLISLPKLISSFVS